MRDLPEFPAGAFARIDESDDGAFYRPARLVTHIDDGAIAELAHFYGKVLPQGGALLDLMSSWVSHLPDDFAVTELVGHGMNAEELAANSRLTQRFVQDLNRDPLLPLTAESFDGAMCCVSVQYLQRPVEVFAEVHRVLKPGAPFVVSFSNRCFPTKAVAIWRALDINGHATLVHLYMERAGFPAVDVRALSNGAYCDPLIAVIGRA